MAAWVNMFWNFYLVKNHKIANNSATTEASEKNKHIFLLTTKLFTKWKIDKDTK